MKKHKEKKPILAGFLNFLLPGLGYVYAGKRINFGISLILFSLIYISVTFNQALTGQDYFFGIILGLIFAYDGYKTAEEVNKK